MVDIPRKSQAKRKKIQRTIWIVVGVLALTGITFGLSRLEPALPSVDPNLVWRESVKRGSMLRQVRGSGTLVPEEIRWIPAISEATVERIVILPGSEVQPDSVILELSNPDLELAAKDAENQLLAAVAEMRSLRIQLKSNLLAQQANTASAVADYRQATLQAEADADLAKDGLVAALTLKLSKVREEDLKQRAAIEQERLAITSESAEAQIAARAAVVAQLEGQATLRRRQVNQLLVRAGVAGVLQQVPVEVGQRVSPGTNLARVAEPKRLKAEVRIPETQARDVVIGLIASIDTRNGVIPGRVTRIDPAVENGTVTVDVALEGPLPRGARPDLSIDGTIELERLDDVLYIGRPAFGQEDGLIGLFLVGEGGVCVRTQVRLGRSSVTTVEIIEGLKEGDEVILSDMSQWDAFDRIRLN